MLIAATKTSSKVAINALDRWTQLFGSLTFLISYNASCMVSKEIDDWLLINYYLMQVVYCIMAGEIQDHKKLIEITRCPNSSVRVVAES